jgi:hypothetical protein
LGQTVSQIEYISRVAARDDNNDNNGTSWYDCRVTTTAGTVYTADACIVTLPLGVLKYRQELQQQQQQQPLFQPNLPDDRRNAIRRSGVGTLNTVVVRWNQPVCTIANKTAYYFLDATTTATTQHHAVTDDARDYNTRRTTTTTTNTTRTTTKTNPLEHGFVCSGLLRGRHDPSLTQFYFHETKGLDFDNETFWKEQAREVVHSLVAASNHHHHHHHSNDDDSDNASCNNPLEVLDIKITQWHNDPHFRGSYSAPTTLTRGNEDRRLLAQPYQNTW